MQELLPTLMSGNTVLCEPSAGGDAQDILLDFGPGDGARILMIEWFNTDDATAGTVLFGVSVDPNEAAPVSNLAISSNTQVIAMVGGDATARAADSENMGWPPTDLSSQVIIVTRNLRLVGYSGVGRSDGGMVKVHYNQVRFTEDELRAITIVNR